MSERLADQLGMSVEAVAVKEEVFSRFTSAFAEGAPTREKNAAEHLLVHFAFYDPALGEVFMGHHKKTGLWLFNGGHVEEGESLKTALEREMTEELGFVFPADSPLLLTITEIDIPNIPCKLHYDIWYFLAVNKEEFSPVPKNLDSEFHYAGWYTIEDAKSLETDLAHVEALDFIKSMLPAE